MNRGEVWTLPDGGRRLVLSPAVYNTSSLGTVITVVVREAPEGFRPFVVQTLWGAVYADMFAAHPRSLLQAAVGRVADDELAEVDRHVRFLVAGL